MQQEAKALSQEELFRFERDGEIVLCGHVLTSDDMTLARHVANVTDPNMEACGNAEAAVVADFTSDPELVELAAAREIATRIQKLRKVAGLQQDWGAYGGFALWVWYKRANSVVGKTGPKPEGGSPKHLARCGLTELGIRGESVQPARFDATEPDVVALRGSGPSSPKL